MIKLQRLENQIEQVKKQISEISFEKKGISYRDSGGYFG